MLKPWSYLSHLHAARFMTEANKGDGEGASSKAPTVAELTQKVTALEADKTRLEGELQTSKDLLTTEQGKATALATDKTKLEGDLKISNEKVTALEADKVKLEGDLKLANTAKEKAEADLKTADNRAETRLREIDAKNGGTLPAKKPGAGDHTTEGNNAETGTPRERLAAGFKVADETQA